MRSTAFRTRVCRTPVLLAFAAPIAAQTWSVQHIAFSIRVDSATVGTPDWVGAGPIGPGNVLTPPVLAPGGNAPLGFPYRTPVLGQMTIPKIVGQVPNRTKNDEIDALSYVSWTTWIRVMDGSDFRFFFSVDARSSGAPTGQIPIESALGLHSADIWRTITPQLITGPSGAVAGCTLELDADGFFGGSPMLGVGLRDHAIRQDDLDAFAFVAPDNRLLTFHSLRTRDALGYGFSGATIFWHNPQAFLSPNGTMFAAITRVYATPAQLGVSSLDDVDALAVFENEVTGYQASGGTFQSNGNTVDGSGFYVQWQAPPGGGMPPTYVRDRIYFSVTRDSPLVGTLDSRFSAAIMPGDVLEPPAPGSPGGTPPRIVCAAEIMGLRASRVLLNLDEMDDLDALEVYSHDG